MWQEAKQKLDPSRLVDDNSPCYGDHVKTDLNSWHFYIDDYAQAQTRIAEMVKNTRPGSTLNYVPGRVQDGAPLWNAEYGGVGSRGGDRDVSWGFRLLTTQLRRHELIQGYVYTELCDVEWEHNGVVDYDRSGQGVWLRQLRAGHDRCRLAGRRFRRFRYAPGGRGRTRRADFAADFRQPFLGAQRDADAAVAHFGHRRSGPPGGHGIRSRRVTWQRYRVKFQEPLRVRMPADQAFVGPGAGAAR